jgi:hypothetical protein
MEDITPLKSKTKYETKSKYIKKYLSNRYDTDEDFKASVNKTRARNNYIRYNTDEEYRNKLLERRKAEYRRKVENKLTHLTPSYPIL